MERERLDEPGYEKMQFSLCNTLKIIKGEKKINQLVLSVLGLLILISFSIVSCKKEAISFTPEEREEVDKLVLSTHSVDSLILLQKKLESEGNKLGSIVALRELGKALRRESRFDEALSAHSEGLRQAEAIGDTLEWIQALNNTGTDYRRMGVLDVAQEYHYSAWILGKECSDTSFTAKKSQVVSLNGLGNIYMTLGNYECADSVLRLALAGERALQSAVGQAINYSNLGSIFERRGETDSALLYYQKSMALNKEVNNELGISLCHTYFGALYEKTQQYEKAMEEYEAAYELMKDSKDEWHAINSLIALASICHATGKEEKEMEFLSKAKAMADRIKSPEHQARIHTLYYKHYKHAGDYRSALTSYEQAVAMQDSVLDMEKMNRIQNTSLKIERNRQTRQMGEARQKLEQERTMRYVGFAILGLILLILAGLLAMLLYTNRLRRRNHLTLKRISALREVFFTNITHEFRTPLTVILGLSHDLQECADSPTEITEKAKVIERQGNGLLTLINQLLDISKIKSSVGNPDWRCGNISAFLSMIAESYHDFALSRNIDLQFFSKDDDVEMDFVPDYVVKVMNNLLSNAFKFTPEYGKVSVVVWREGDLLQIEVSDTGKGIDPEALAYIFEPFYQAESDVYHIGTGVGLALVKQIMDAIDGKITVESAQGKGTTFYISVPIHNYCQQPLSDEMEYNQPFLPEGTEPLEDSAPEDSRCHLLIVEDNRDIAAYIGSQLANHYAISYAVNGLEGLEKAQELVPDLIITDLMMPEMDGLELCRQVRKNEIISHIPIIVVTAKISEEERIKGIEAGADAYLAKPFNSDELRTRVEKLLEGRRLLQEKFMQTVIESKENREEEATQPDESDLRFLTKITDTVYLQLNRHKEVNVSLIASNMCMSSSQFYRKLVALTGYTPAAYIQRIKIKKAKILLDGDPNISFSEVADQCGFNNYSNFVRAFKNVCGITPTDYKKDVNSSL